LAAGAICEAQPTSPGWHRINKAAPPAQSRDSSTSQASFQSAALVQSQTQFAPLNQPNVPSSPIAEAITPQIQALADGLQDNPTNIFNYVHDHIKFVPYFGSKKGANLTLLEKSGNDFDQCALLVALLSAAGYSNNVQYQFGWQAIPYDDPNGKGYDLHHWWQLTLNNTVWTNTVNYVWNLAVVERGYPKLYYYTDGNTLEFQRMWVALTLGSTTYQLDPAFKISQPIATLPGFSLTNTMGGTSATISNALLVAAGGTANGNYAQSLNEAALRNQLTTYTTNLLYYIQTNAPNASIQDILGGWSIVPAYDPWDFTTSTLFYVDTFGGQMPVFNWTYEPTNMMSTLQIQFAGISYQCFMPQLQGRRLALVFDNRGFAQLWQDDALLAQNATIGRGTTNVVIYARHPDGIWDSTNNVFINEGLADDVTTNAYQCTNATYALLYAFEPDWGWLQQRQNILDAYLQAGLTNGSRQVTSETLNVMGLNWMLQTAQTERMVALQLGILPQWFHRIGRMAQEIGHGYYVDVYMQLSGEYPSGGSDKAHIQTSNIYFDMFGFFGSALEHGLIEELQNSSLVAASTVKMLQIANANGQAVYLASSTNWTTGYNVQSHLTAGTYDSGTLASIAGYINQGYYVLMPQSGSNHVSGTTGSWAGYGYEARQAINGGVTVSAMIIAGGYHGGYVSVPTALPNTAYTDLSGDNQPTYYNNAPTYTPTPPTADPLDTADATFQVENTDLSLGQAEPRGITLSRYYNGTRRLTSSAGMTGGWIHNYCITANNVPAPAACLGDSTPAQAAAMITATAAAIATYNGGYPDPKNWLSTVLISKWGIDQVTKSGVSVNLGKDTLQFVQQPNGVFTPPASCTMTLTQNGSSYVLQQRHGNTFNFNSSGLLSSIVDPYNQSLNLGYNGNNWVSTVTDWKSRSLTFNYSGTPLRLTSITDGTRTSYYGYTTNYNPQGDLTSFTDTEGQTSTYIYDGNHQITATIDAQSRLVVSNLYDSQGHVIRQFTQGDANKMWKVYWSGWQTTEFDPAGGETDYLYDDQSRLIAVVDPLGCESDTFYDGQNHIVATVSPLSETNLSVYDGQNNLVRTVDPLGFTNRFVYDSTNNLIKAIDPLGNTNSFGYNAQFSLTGQTNGAGDWVNYAYNSDGTLYTRTDPGGTTTNGYDSFGFLKTITYPNGLGGETNFNSSFGDVTNHVDGRGFSTIYKYNSRRQLTNSIAPTNLTVSISYDPVGNKAGMTDPRGNQTLNTWGATRLLLATTLPATPQGTPVVTNIYDNRDLLIKTIDPLQNATLYANDANERLISQTDPVLRTTTFGYDADGHKIATTNAAREVIRQTWDPRGSLAQLADGASRTSSRVYDGAGNQIMLTNRNGKVWRFKFDGANRLTNTITPLGHQTIESFNHQGMLASITDAKQQPASFYYDAKGRLTNRTDNVGATFYRYDQSDNRTNLTENALTNTWTYDAYNRVSSYKDVYGNLLQYRYDASGNMTNLIYPGGKNVYYTYDSNNHMTNVTDWSGRKTGLAYDLAGRLIGVTRPNGTQRILGYDAAGEATSILEQTASGSPISLFRYDWNAATEMQWEFAAPLPHATNALPLRTMVYDDDNELKTVDGNNVAVDLDGNLTSGPLTNDTFAAYNYDARNRLKDAGGVTNAYDAMNNRIGQTQGTNVTTFVVNPNAKLPQVLMRIKNGVTNYYIYGAGLLYQVTEMASGTNTLTYHYDYRGSTVALTDDNGNVTDRIEYSLYATTTYRAGTNDTPFLFNGRFGVMTDPNGLLYMRARYYDTFLCRFLNPDPTGFSGGMNFFAYANGNPVSYLDPFGLSFWSVATHFAEGVAVGAIITAAVIVAAPVIATAGAAALVAAGVEGTAALAFSVGAVDATLCVAGGVGATLTAVDTGVNISQGNWDAAAYNIGNVLGGYGVGVSGGGRFLADSLGVLGGNGLSPAPELSPFDLRGAWQYERLNRLKNPFGEDSDLLGWLASAPTPFSGGFSATSIASGITPASDIYNQYLQYLPDLMKGSLDNNISPMLGNGVSPTAFTTSTGK
jgi:RHS repeat-associated protein